MASQTSASASSHGLAHSRTASAASSARRARIHAAARTRISARLAAGVADQRAKPRAAVCTASSTSASVARARGRRRRARDVPGSVDVQRIVVALAVADPHRHAQRQRGLERGHAREQLVAHRRAAQLADRLVDEGRQVGHGAASRLVERAPRAPARAGRTRCSCSPAGGAPGRPCRRRGRRPGSTCARAGRAWPAPPGGRRRGRAGPGARGPRRRRRGRGWRRSRGRSSAGCGAAIATRTAGRASSRRRVSASKLRSESALTSKTGDCQPCWRASTISWSQ